MRLPFIQVSQEEMARARTLAGYLGVPYAHALGMTVALKAAALESAPEGDVSGAIQDPNPAEWMAVQCGWPLDRADALATALARCGFAMAGPSGCYAVASMEPYAKALDTSGKRSEAGRRGAEERWRRRKDGRAIAGPQQTHGKPMARDAKTQTQTQTQKEESPSGGTAAAIASSAPPLTLAVQEAEKPKRAPSPTALGEFIDWARAETKARLPADALDPAAGMKQHERVKLGEAVRDHGLETCKAAFRLFSGWQVAQEKGYSVGFFANQWETWLRQVKASGAKPAAASAGKPTVGGYGYDNPYVQALVEAMPAPKKRGA